MHGGKIKLLERGAFEGVHAALMAHPAPFDLVEPPIIAAALLDIEYTGKEAHASAFPERGINAADALTVAQTAIGLLRQHIRPSDRIHGFVTKGGEAANIIPAHTAAQYMVRSRAIKELEQLLPRVHRCFEAGALATGATVKFTAGDNAYSEMRHDQELAQIYRNNVIALGRKVLDRNPGETQPDLTRGAGSTDMGNISLRIPSIHPYIGIDSLPAVNHQPEFTAHCATAIADYALFDGALALAWTAIDAAASPQVRDPLLARTRP
jgi:metal-dependent amidase/aminoacylase/carboxypeptidase family protein